MKKRYSLVVIMILLSLLLGGCSLMTDQSTEKQEMIQIAESQKMKVAIESYKKSGSRGINSKWENKVL